MDFLPVFVLSGRRNFQNFSLRRPGFDLWLKMTIFAPWHAQKNTSASCARLLLH